MILTSKDQAGDRFWGLETGADYYITKDAEPQRILELVQEHPGPPEARPARAAPPAPRTSVDILCRVNELLDRKLYEATILSEIGRVARSLVHFDETFTSVMALVARVVDFTLGGDGLRRGRRPGRVAAAAAPGRAGRDRRGEGAAAGGDRARARRRALRARAGAPVHARGGAAGAEETALGGFAAFPIATNDQLAGLLALGGQGRARRIGAETEAFLAQVAEPGPHRDARTAGCSSACSNLSIRDSLTDLFNHRHAMELLARASSARVGRYEGGVSVLMIDIDHFKKVNDEHGHQAGDVVLREVARVLKDTLRTVDALGRYGGEEFVAILPHTELRRGAADGRAAARARSSEHAFQRRRRASCASRSAWASRPTPPSASTPPAR